VFNGRLTAMGGINTRKVEVYDKEGWNDQTITSLGNTDGNLWDFTSLATKTHLFVFGKN